MTTLTKHEWQNQQNLTRHQKHELNLIFAAIILFFVFIIGIGTGLLLAQIQPNNQYINKDMVEYENISF